MRSATVGLPLAFALLAGCGGGGASTSTSSTSATGASVGAAGTTESSGAQSNPEHPVQSNSEPGGDGPPGYRLDASAADRAKAASTVSSYFKARSWGKACSYLSASLRRHLEAASRHSNLSAPAGKGCAGAMAAFLGTRTPAAPLAAAEVHPISLRIKGSQALLAYRDGGGTSHYIPLRREGGGWKVDFPIDSGSTSGKAK